MKGNEIYDHELDNRIESTIKKIYSTWPSYAPKSYDDPGEKYLALRNMFYIKLTDKQIGLFRYWWHQWKVDNMLEREKDIREFIKNWID